MVKIKSGEKITWKEFFHRWKIGIDNITPIQKMKHETRATFIMSFGMVAGFIVMILQIKLLSNNIGWLAYAMLITFLGGSYSNVVRYLAMRGSLKQLRKQDDEAEVKSLDEIFNVNNQLKGGKNGF